MRVRLWVAALALLLVSAVGGAAAASLHFGRTAAQPPSGEARAGDSPSLPPTAASADGSPVGRGGTAQRSADGTQGSTPGGESGSTSGESGPSAPGGEQQGAGEGVLLPLPKGEGRLAIVIDDMGQGLSGAEDLLAMDRPLTFSFLPHTRYLRREVAEATAHGHQVLLHLPMEPLPDSGARPGSDAIYTEMSDEQVEELIRRLAGELPEARGVNNHMGSLATSDAHLMLTVMSTLKSLNLPFVDSRTVSTSVAYETARSVGLPAATNSLFIDGEKTVFAVKSRLRQAALIAQRHGAAVVIGHPHPAVARAIREMAPVLEEAGVRLVFVTDLLN